MFTSISQGLGVEREHWTTTPVICVRLIGWQYHIYLVIVKGNRLDFWLMRRLQLLQIIFASTIIASNSVIPLAKADEIWMSEGRTIKWLDSRGSTAIFKMQNTGGNDVYFYIAGLASDVLNKRGSYTGYWVTRDNGLQQCSMPRRSAGRSSYNWGNLAINFTSNSFPYSWTARYGQCNGSLDQSMKAVPLMQAN